MKNKLQKLFLYFFLSTLIINNLTTNAQESLLNKSIDTSNYFINNNIIKDASDSINVDIVNQKLFLYGNASIEYEQTKISAGIIVIDWNENTINARAIMDSLGNMIGYPVFNENGRSFKAKEMTYNYKTKKSFIKKISTKEGEGFIHGQKVKKTEEEIYYINKADYTTCDAEKPHFSIRSNKVKIIPGKSIISGPAYLRFFNIPTPIFLPFGYFPNNEKKSSGVIVPAYGESDNLGFFLKEGGYYFNINEKIDLTIKGDIYIKGSWAGRSLFRYKERYKYNGSVNLSYSNIINSERGLPDYSIKRDFFIKWQHQQDIKANPSLFFSANVNAGSSTFHRNNSINTDDFLSNTFQSGISLTKRWDNSPFNLSFNVRHSQNTNTKIVNLSIPDVSFSMNRVFPLRRLGNQAKTNWYDKIGISYTMNTKNNVTIADSLLFTKNLFGKFRYGVMHSIPIGTSIKFLKHFNLTPKINFTERWYPSRIEKFWDSQNEVIVTDTISKFTRAHSYNLSANMNTKIYGLATFKKGRIAGFRHVLTPNLGFSYNPDFSNQKYGYYKNVQNNSNGDTQIYSIMENGIFGSPQRNQNGNINLGISNNIEMKIRQKDSLQTIKKIKLLENINLSTGYNIFSDSLNFRNIVLNARTNMLNIFDLTFSSIYDPYKVNKNKNGIINELEILSNNRIARFVSANASVMLRISNETFKSKEKKDEKKSTTILPWDLNLNYNLSYNKGYGSSESADTTQSLAINGNLKISNKWKFGVRSGYDFDTKKITYTSIDIYRDLHCWEMIFNWIPIGYRKSYMLTIRVKSNVLKDLKLERKKEWLDPEYN